MFSCQVQQQVVIILPLPPPRKYQLVAALVEIYSLNLTLFSDTVELFVITGIQRALTST